MLLKSDEIAKRLSEGIGDNPVSDPLRIVPVPEIEHLRDSGTGSVDLRLGRWFLILRQDRTEIFDVIGPDQDLDPHFARPIFVPFGTKFVVHPGAFVLGTTLEWVRLPADLGAFITGKSSWGRRGLVIETAAGVHPGFTGCLTLEISNLGGVPIAIRPGTELVPIRWTGSRVI